MLFAAHHSRLIARPVWALVLLCLAHSVAPPLGIAQEPDAEPRMPRILTLDHALQLAASKNPALAASRFGLASSQSRERDAGRMPNPSFRLDVENWGGGDANNRETTVGLGQPIEIGGDRRARAGLARTETDLARADLQATGLEVASQVTNDFLEAWETQERLWQLRSARRIAAEAVTAASERLRAGAASAVEGMRAQVNLTVTEAAVLRAEAALSAARRDVALRWGDRAAMFDSLALDSLPPSVSADSLVQYNRLQNHPALLRARSEIQAAAARVAAARAERIPDLEAVGGLRTFGRGSDRQLVAGIGLPLPLWNRQSGTLGATLSDQSRAELQAQALANQLEVSLRNATERYRAAVAAHDRLREQATPLAQQALASLSAAYRAGRLSYVDLAEGQRVALETRLALIEATAEMWRTRMALELLVGAQTEGLEER